MSPAQPFDQLLRTHRLVKARTDGPDSSIDKPTSKTATLRAYLKRQGRAKAADLAIEADLANTGLVWALLKGDINKGAVVREGEWYVWDESHDEKRHCAIKAAIRLLKSAGYQVSERNTEINGPR